MRSKRKLFEANHGALTADVRVCFSWPRMPSPRSFDILRGCIGLQTFSWRWPKGNAHDEDNPDQAASMLNCHCVYLCLGWVKELPLAPRSPAQPDEVVWGPARKPQTAAPLGYELLR